MVDELSTVHRAQEEAGFRPARVVLVINRARWGGGRRMEGHLAHALVTAVHPDDIVVVYTDESLAGPAGRYPDGVRKVDFASIVRGLSGEQSQHALVALLRSFQADAIVNVNSKLLYHAMRTYGRALAVSERLFLVLFCNEQRENGLWEGWSLSHFYRAFDHASGVITDSDYLVDELTDRYGLGENERARLHVLRVPVDGDLPLHTEAPPPGVQRPQVFWAGRWDRQKRVDLLREVARRMPDVDFRMWGEPVLRGGKPPTMPRNVVIHGRYNHISEIPLAEADAWLYTSAWDGVPSQLLEVAMTGIPIVGTVVGGTGEVINEVDAQPVKSDEGAEAYVQGIRWVLNEPARARRRAVALRTRLLHQRNEMSFANRVAELLLSDGMDRARP